MKRLIPLLLVLVLGACSRSDDKNNGSGTRGGGDACELDYRSHLQSAFLWLKKIESVPLTDTERTRISELSLAHLDRIDVACSREPIFVDGVRKTAYTEARAGHRASMLVDPNLWFIAPRGTRTSVAAHEILVLLGVENTGDYHISSYFMDGESLPLVDSLECGKQTRNRRAFSIHLKRTDDPFFTYRAEFHFTSWGEDPAVRETQVVKLSENLACFFSEDDLSLFTCYESLGGIGRTKLALEMLNSSNGVEVRAYWPALRAPSADFETTRKLARDLALFTLNPPIETGVSIFLGPRSDFALEAPEALSCRVVESDQ